MNSPFSPDENGNFTSTPIKKRKRQEEAVEYTCSICDKKYRTKLNRDKHEATHRDINTATSANCSDINISINISLQDADVSFGSIVSGSSAFKIPTKENIPKKKAKPKFICTYCKKGYLCLKSYNTHLMNHRIQDAASRYPNKPKILCHAQSICKNALESTSRAPCAGEAGELYKRLVTYIEEKLLCTKEWATFASQLCSDVLECDVGVKFLLPSALLGCLLKRVEQLLDSGKLRNMFEGMFDLSQLDLKVDQRNDYTYGSALSQFILEFMLNITKEVISFISKEVQAIDKHKLSPKRIPELDTEDRNVIYYIGGSIIKGFYRVAYRYKSSVTWSKIALVLKEKVVSDDPSKIHDASWTLAVNRGGLVFISLSCQEFLLSLTEVVFSNEKKDGSINYEEVIKTVTNGATCVLWDLMISDALKENVSLELMNDIIKYFCRTCGRGFAKKRLNFLRERPVVSLPTRHLAASRKRK